MAEEPPDTVQSTASSSDSSAPAADQSAFPQYISQLTKDLGAPDGALLSLISDSDWAMIIKSHALIEGAVTLLLTTALNEAALSPAFSRLPLGEDITGKLAFAKALGLLKLKERRFIKRLSELRNMLAHDPRHLAFTLREYVAGMDNNQLATFQDLLTFGVAREKLQSVRLRVTTNTRSVFNVTVIYFLTELLTRITYVRLAAYLTPNERRKIFEALGTEGQSVVVVDGAVMVVNDASPIPPLEVFYPQHHRDCAVFNHREIPPLPASSPENR